MIASNPADVLAGEGAANLKKMLFMKADKVEDEKLSKTFKVVKKLTFKMVVIQNNVHTGAKLEFGSKNLIWMQNFKLGESQVLMFAQRI